MSVEHEEIARLTPPAAEAADHDGWALVRREWEIGNHGRPVDAFRKLLSDGAYHAGRAAFISGAEDNVNPWPKGSVQHGAWNNGWCDAEHAAEARPAAEARGLADAVRAYLAAVDNHRDVADRWGPGRPLQPVCDAQRASIAARVALDAALSTRTGGADAAAGGDAPSLRDILLGLGIDTSVANAISEGLDEQQIRQPHWLWHDNDHGQTSYGRWAKVAGSAPYFRGDILAQMFAHLTPARGVDVSVAGEPNAHSFIQHHHPDGSWQCQSVETGRIVETKRDGPFRGVPIGGSENGAARGVDAPVKGEAVLVPREPTPEMIAAGRFAETAVDGLIGHAGARDCWSAMVAAAPPPSRPTAPVDRMREAVLLPCPFCGSEPSMEPCRGQDAPNRAISCDNDECPINPFVSGFTGDSALEKWNTRAALATAEGEAAVGALWRHVKRGTVYREIGRASLQTSTTCLEGAVVVIYRGADGRLWARPDGEFQDGRFVRVNAPPADRAAGPSTGDGSDV